VQPGLAHLSDRDLFFPVDFTPLDAAEPAENLKLHDMPVKPLNDRHLGQGYFRVTAALPADNACFIAPLKTPP